MANDEIRFGAGGNILDFLAPHHYNLDVKNFLGMFIASFPRYWETFEHFTEKLEANLTFTQDPRVLDALKKDGFLKPELKKLNETKTIDDVEASLFTQKNVYFLQIKERYFDLMIIPIELDFNFYAGTKMIKTEEDHDAQQIVGEYANYKMKFHPCQFINDPERNLTAEAEEKAGKKAAKKAANQAAEGS